MENFKKIVGFFFAIVTIMIGLLLMADGKGMDLSSYFGSKKSTTIEENNVNGKTGEKSLQISVENGNLSAKIKENTRQRVHISPLGNYATFQGFEFTFDGSYEFVDVKYNDYDIQKFIKLPVTICNKNDDSEMFGRSYYNIFTPAGTSAEEELYMYDDDITDIRMMRPGVKVDTYFLFKYEGDGEYVIEMKYLNDDVEIYVDVSQ